MRDRLGLNMKKKGINYLIGIGVGIVLPLLFRLAGGYWVHMLFTVGIFSILAVSLNLILGYTGQMNLAHSVLFGFGAYTSALLVKISGINFWVSIPLAGIATVIVGIVIGCITLRLRGYYFALATFAFLFMMKGVFLNLRDITGGVRGLTSIPSASIGGFILDPSQRLIWVYIVFAFLLFTIFIMDRIVNSRVGTAFIAISQDEDLARSSGVNIFSYKLLSFSIATFFAGIAGALYATYMTAFSPADCGLMPFFMMIASCVIGGMSTLVGPVLGTIVVQLLPELLRVASVYYYLIFGLLMIILAIYAPKGIMGWITSLQDRLKSRSSNEEVKDGL